MTGDGSVFRCRITRASAPWPGSPAHDGTALRVCRPFNGGAKRLIGFTQIGGLVKTLYRARDIGPRQRRRARTSAPSRGTPFIPDTTGSISHRAGEFCAALVVLLVEVGAQGRVEVTIFPCGAGRIAGFDQNAVVIIGAAPILAGAEESIDDIAGHGGGAPIRGIDDGNGAVILIKIRGSDGVIFCHGINNALAATIQCGGFGQVELLEGNCAEADIARGAPAGAVCFPCAGRAGTIRGASIRGGSRRGGEGRGTRISPVHGKISLQ